MKLSNVDETPIYDRIKVVSFTGTRQGTTKNQRKALKSVLSLLEEATVLVHGDCLGSDEEAGEIADELGLEVQKRPSNLPTRAWSKIGKVISRPRNALERNKDIIDDGDALVACPAGMKSELRSGTWAAIRYAKSQGALIWYVWPDGSVTSPEDNLSE